MLNSITLLIIQGDSISNCYYLKVVFCNFNEPYSFLFKSVSHALSIFNAYQYQINNKNNIIIATKFIKNSLFK